MKYSDYNIEQLMNNIKYKEICNMFIRLSKDSSMKEKLESILYQGGYKDYIPASGMTKNNLINDIERRLSLAYLLVNNPSTFEKLIENKVNFFHGTKSNALEGILKYGINSATKSTEDGINLTTGEESTRINGRSFVSFTDVLDLAEDYARIYEKGNNELSFPVVFGTTKDNICSQDYVRVPSDYPEIGIYNNFSKELITSIMVPSNKVDIVKKIVTSDMLVLPMDNILDKFYTIDTDSEIISIDYEKYENMKKGVFNKQDELKGVKESVFKRTIKNIKKRIYEFNNITKGNEVNERRTFK